MSDNMRPDWRAGQKIRDRTAGPPGGPSLVGLAFIILFVAGGLYLRHQEAIDSIISLLFIGIIVIAVLLLVWGMLRYRRNRKTFEYDEFVLHWEPGELVVKVDMDNASEQAVRKAYWQHLKPQIIPRLEERLNDGWQVAGLPLMNNVGPHNLKLKKRKGIFASKTQFDIQEFRVQLRRPLSETQHTVEKE